MARRADKEGMLLWEEVPAYWDVTFSRAATNEQHRQQLTELVQRDWNRASVALWSVANEMDHEDKDRNEMLPTAVEHVRALEDTRLLTAACFIDEADDGGLVVEDPLAESLDVFGLNEYYGWYEGEMDELQKFADPEGPSIVVSEFGAGAQ